MDIVLAVIAGASFVVAALTLVASITEWLKRKLPVEFGFLLDDSIVDELNLSSSDKAKPITLRFRNKAGMTLAGL